VEKLRLFGQKTTKDDSLVWLFDNGMCGNIFDPINYSLIAILIISLRPMFKKGVQALRRGI
jgi:hypothetical protein